MKHSKPHRRNWKKEVFSGLGTGVILGTALLSTALLYQYGIENKIFTNNLTTSVLFSDTLSTANGAAPWVLMSFNWFLCKSGVKHWRKFIAQFYE